MKYLKLLQNHSSHINCISIIPRTQKSRYMPIIIIRKILFGMIFERLGSIQKTIPQELEVHQKLELIHTSM